MSAKGLWRTAVAGDMKKIPAARISPYPDPAFTRCYTKVSTGPVNNQAFNNKEDLLK